MDLIGEYSSHILIIALTTALLSLFWTVFLELRLKRVFRGTRAKDLEGVIKKASADIKELRGGQEEIFAYLKKAEYRIKSSVKHIGMVRFDAFNDAGGNQSFAVALLDEKKDGVVISSLYGREANRTYAKTVAGGESEYKLSEEEKEAVQKAIAQ